MMKSFTISALGIAFKIWFFAVLINTVADTFFLNGLRMDFFEIALIIAFFASLFSAPVFLLFWAITYHLLTANKSAAYLFTFLLIAGVGLSIITWLVFAMAFHFFESDAVSLAIATPVSAVLAIFINYPAIKKVCYARDASRKLIESLGTEPITT